MFGRREFISGSTAFAASIALAKGRTEPKLRVGVLSDIHITTDEDVPAFEKALRYFDTRKVDAVLISGDLTRWNWIREFELVAATWYRVFPDDRRSDGEPVERLFVTGNHDVDGWAYKPAGFASVEEARETSFFFHRDEVWQRLFHEPYRQVSMKEVKGYRFVLRNWLSILGRESRIHPLAEGFRDEPNPVEEFLSRQDLGGEKPFFYVQHEQPDDTVNATWLVGGVRWTNGQDDGTAKRILSKYPNCICLSGHSHNSLTDELSIWQGAFTAVNCSALTGFPFCAPGRENGWSMDDFGREPPLEMPCFDKSRVRQGMLMEVYEDAVVFRRHEFVCDRQLGPDWIVPTGSNAPRPYTFEKRLKEAKKPAFPKGAEVVVRQGDGYGRNAAGTGRAKEKHAQVFVSFPAVRTTDGSPVRAWDYAVRVELVTGDVVKTACERCVFSEGVFQAEEEETKPVVCAFNRKDIPSTADSRQKIRFVVTPRSCWGVEGDPIATSWMSVGAIKKNMEEGK